jgi:hypothetical protein
MLVRMWTNELTTCVLSASPGGAIRLVGRHHSCRRAAYGAIRKKEVGGAVEHLDRQPSFPSRQPQEGDERAVASPGIPPAGVIVASRPSGGLHLAASTPGTEGCQGPLLVTLMAHFADS